MILGKLEYFLLVNGAGRVALMITERMEVRLRAHELLYLSKISNIKNNQLVSRRFPE